ncbi:MAG: VOC family protein [Lentisphaeraceae bacterium]|nr:VOC family protein [Lentisphaeraceae bacterium]
MIQQIHHVQLTVDKGQEEEAMNFYCEVMGFTRLKRPPSLEHIPGGWLEIAGQQVHIRGENSSERKSSSSHIAYHVQDLESWKNKLVNQDLAILEGIPIPGMNRFEFRDPFGNRIEMLELLA